MKNIIFKEGVRAFKFNELSEDAKSKAIMDEIDFMLETLTVEEYEDLRESESNFIKAIDEAERLQTPWFVHGIIYEYCKEEFEQIMENNNTYYDESGNLLPITEVDNEYYFKVENERVKVEIQ